MKVKTLSNAALRAAEKERKAVASEQLGRDAEVESARIRAMFDEDRKVLARRYGVITALS